MGVNNLKNWTSAEDNYLQSNYGAKTAKQIGDDLGRSRSAVKNRCTSLGLKQDPETRARQCNIGKFTKGKESWNKGLKQSEYMSAAAIEKTKATRFQKGITPHNTKNNGDIVIRHKNTDRPYYFIRISVNNWQLLHIHLWQTANGKVPENGIVRFKDGNSMNCVLENLELIDTTEHMKRNTIHRYPDEIKELIRLQSKLNHKISKIENNG